MLYDIDESDDEIEYEEIPTETFEEESDSEIEETLEQACRNINEKGAFTCIRVLK